MVSRLDAAAGERTGDRDAERRADLAARRRDRRRQACLRSRHSRDGRGVDGRTDAAEAHSEDRVSHEEHGRRGVVREPRQYQRAAGDGRTRHDDCDPRTPCRDEPARERRRYEESQRNGQRGDSGC